MSSIGVGGGKGAGAHARVASSTATTTTVVAGQAGKKIRIRYVHVSADGNVLVYFRFSSESAATARLFPSYLSARNPTNANKVDSVIEGPAGDDFQMVTDAAVNVECQVDYDLK